MIARDFVVFNKPLIFPVSYRWFLDLKDDRLLSKKTQHLGQIDGDPAVAFLSKTLESTTNIVIKLIQKINIS